MKNIKIITAVIIFMFFSIISCKGEPKIKFAETSYDFGDVKQNEEYEHIFIFKNTGSGLLIIEKVKAG